MKRRILSLLLAALLLLPVTVFAATGPVSITSEDVHGNVGDTVTVTLNIDIEPPKVGQTMDSLQFVLEYDSAALEYVGIQELSQDRINILGAQYTCSVTTKTGAVAFTAASSGGCTGSGVLMHVRFKILSALSTMLVMKKVSYSFVSSNAKDQKNYSGIVINLGRVTGQSAPATIAPSASVPAGSQQPTAPTIVATDEPRFPVTEVTPAPGASPEPDKDSGDSDMLAYIVFGLFIIVAILICVVLTLMIVRRGQNKARIKYFEDDEEEDEPFTVAQEDEPVSPDAEEDILPEEEEDEPPIQIVRRGKKTE